jgi:hypothetical protein
MPFIDSLSTQFLLSTSFNANPIVIHVKPNLSDVANSDSTQDDAVPQSVSVLYTTSTLFYEPCGLDLTNVVVENPRFCKINPDLFARLIKDLQDIGNVIIDGFSLRQYFVKTGTVNDSILSVRAALLRLPLPPRPVLDAITLPIETFDLTLPEAAGLLYIKKLQEYGKDALDWVETANLRALKIGSTLIKLKDYMHRLPKRPTECATFPSTETGQSRTSSDSEDAKWKADVERSWGTTVANLDDSEPTLNSISSPSDSTSSWDTPVSCPDSDPEFELGLKEHMELAIQPDSDFEEPEPVPEIKVPTAPTFVPRPLTPELNPVPSPVAIAVAGSVTANPYPYRQTRKRGKRAFTTYRDRYCTRNRPDVECLYHGMAHLGREDQTTGDDEIPLIQVDLIDE